MSPATSPSPVASVLLTLATAYRTNMVSYAAVPEECQPPRFVVEFRTGADVRAFEEHVHQLADAGPLLPRVLGEIAAEVTGYDGVASITSAEVLQHLIHVAAGDLMEVVEDFGPVKVIRASPQYRDHLVTIAALAIVGLLAESRSQAEDTMAAYAEGRRPQAACTDGIPKPEVIYHDVPAHRLSAEEG